ncbi:sigma-70 family RNA polymerase sigma factor [Flavobacterium silvisoli]|uniref:Sigma-70 family RNA polymerase sigma factor n=1 Tax=Flavobacterium silvisoli TaxID=2529433 RepID=A0A4Q9YZC9_9FLAO|nr:sigma-70 family RNA polymerase sigma factor [Flavobacterium silvisoli]TBX69227.1 sigma-70 family RNA polymerase sigma factor [Flavobacterium silvisoli]
MSENNSNQRLCSDAVFRSVFDANFKVLRNFLVYKFRGDIETAEDVAQNAFVKLWENCSILKPEQAKSFLYTTAIRISLNNIKHDKVVANFELQLKTKDNHKESPDLLLEETELKARLEKAINDLPAKQRTVFLMNRFDNQSYPEIASALNLSVKAVEKRMHLALLALRKVVKNV